MQIVTLNEKEYIKLDNTDKPLVRENLVSKSQLSNEIDELKRMKRIKQDEVDDIQSIINEKQEIIKMFK